MSRLGQTALRIAKRFAVGGSQWVVRDPDGTPRGQVELYVRRIEERVPVMGGLGFETDTRWTGVGPLTSTASDAAHDGVWPGRVITSVAQPSLVLYVADAVDTLAGVTKAPLEPKRD